MNVILSLGINRKVLSKLIPINIIIYVGEEENLNDKLFIVSRAAFYASTYLQPRLLMEGALICFFYISGVEILKRKIHHSLWTETKSTNKIKPTSCLGGLSLYSMVVLTKRAILQKAGGHRTAEKCQLQRRERLQREIWNGENIKMLWCCRTPRCSQGYQSLVMIIITLDAELLCNNYWLLVFP